MPEMQYAEPEREEIRRRAAAQHREEIHYRKVVLSPQTVRRLLAGQSPEEIRRQAPAQHREEIHPRKVVLSPETVRRLLADQSPEEIRRQAPVPSPEKIRRQADALSLDDVLREMAAQPSEKARPQKTVPSLDDVLREMAAQPSEKVRPQKPVLSFDDILREVDVQPSEEIRRRAAVLSPADIQHWAAILPLEDIQRWATVQSQATAEFLWAEQCQLAERLPKHPHLVRSFQSAEQGWLKKLWEKPKDEAISCAFDIYMNYAHDFALKSFGFAGVNALMMQTISNDVITALFADHLLHRKKGDDDFSAYVDRSQASQRLKEIEKIQKELPEGCSEITRQYVQGIYDAYKEVLDNATSKVHRTWNKVRAVLGSVIRRGAIGLTINGLGILFGIGPVAQVGSAKLIDWFMDQFEEEGYWKGTALQDILPELRPSAAYQRGRAHGKAACCHELLKLREELRQGASLPTSASWSAGNS